ncbi:replication protein A 70 kDa DNA-binding subunit B-like isoform X2 [Senna tora]|uniref:Replication protein A 70 kDa DNA-binding subunit B-like isoform X2 n=1 Tax=Senna tora TaxID=362788 RepID=A0A834SZ05_9FABA|nr:replication protein A 70 kDa DNA-binding subunit B-like isoform X2 [Senna tora]
MYHNKFKGALAEGKVYVLSRFDVGQSGGNFRVTPHALKINFLFGTRVMPTVNDSTIHRYGFALITAESITSGQTDDKTLVDVIDRLTNIGDVIQSSKEDISSKRGDDDSVFPVQEFDKFFGTRFVFKVGVTVSKWSPTPFISVQKMSWDEELIKKLTAESSEDESNCNGIVNNVSAVSEDVVELDAADVNVTPNQGSTTPIDHVDGRCLSFSKENTSENGDTPSSKKRIASGGNLNEGASNNVSVEEISSQIKIKKIKLEKNA